MTNHLILLFTNSFHTLSPNVQQEIYQEFYELVYNMVYHIIKDHGAAEDIVQDAFLRSIEKADQLKELDKYEGWLRKLTRNVTLNYLRKFKRDREELDTDEVFISKEVANSYVVETIHQEVETKLMEEALIAYLSQLKPEYRQIFEMRWIENLSYKEMAVAMNVSEGIIRQKLYRAREMIKLKMENEWRHR